MAGRPTKRSPERITAILNALKVGNTRRAAAGAAEINELTLARWMAADVGFRSAVENAEHEAERRFLTIVAKAATTGTWTAAAWWLERRKNADYARHDKLDMQIDLRKEAERLALEQGLDPDAVLAEAEAILGRKP
jgi:hypothetical protein